MRKSVNVATVICTENNKVDSLHVFTDRDGDPNWEQYVVSKVLERAYHYFGKSFKSIKEVEAFQNSDEYLDDAYHYGVSVEGFVI